MYVVELEYMKVSVIVKDTLLTVMEIVEEMILLIFVEYVTAQESDMT